MEASSSDLSSSMSELSELLLATGWVQDALQQVTDNAVRAVPVAVGAGLTLQLEDRLGTAAATGPVPRRLDEEQYSRGQGPCLDAAHSGQASLVQDFRNETRWGAYPGVVAAAGMRSLYSEPVWAPGALGALNLYSPLAAGFGAAERAVVKTYADQAALVLTLTLGAGSRVLLTGQLRKALAARAVIDQAVGVLVAQHGCSVAEGFSMLQAASARHDVPLRRAAADIVEAVSTTRTGRHAPEDQVD